MTLDAFLLLLDTPRQRANGWHEACCPAHADTHPSLKVRAGDRGVIVKCWAGCTTQEICEALGIKVRGLFFDAEMDQTAYRKRRAQRLVAHDERLRQGKRIDTLREADYFVRAQRGLDISGWTDTQLDRALDVLAKAYAILDTEDAWI